MDKNQFETFMKMMIDKQQQNDQALKEQQEQNRLLIERLAIATTATTATIKGPNQLEIQQGDINTNWESWRENFETYCAVTGIDKYPVEREPEKLKLLMLFIGDPAKRKYNNFTLTEEEKTKPIKEILDIIGKKVMIEQPVLLERYKFSKIQQEEDESIRDFLKRVEKAADKCDLLNMTKEKIIRDRMIFGAKEENLKKKCFDKKEAELTLEQVLTMGEAIEATTRFLDTVSEKKDQTVQKVEMRKKNDDLCKYCREKHKKGAKFCGAYGKECSFCKGKNHTEKACFKKKSKQLNNEQKHVKKLEEDSEDQEINKIIDQSKDGKGVQAEILMKFNDVWSKVNCDIDTGACASIIGHNFLQEMLQTKEPKLDKSHIKLSSVNKAQINVLGSILILGKHKKKTYKLRFQVVDFNHGPLLSANASKALGLVKFCNKVTTIIEEDEDAEQVPKDLKQQAQNIMDEYADVFDEKIGKFPGKVKLEIDPNIVPVHEKPRRFPTAKRDILKKELEKLEKMGIIKKQNEPTDFLSNILLVIKNDKVRLCLDPINLNKALKVPDRQQTTLDEILPELAKAMIYTSIDAAKGYWQCELEEESSKLTTFSTPFGNYRWLRLPFGISPASSIFTTKLTEAMTGIDGAEAMADDIVIYGCGKNITEATKDHNLKLKALMQKMRTNNCKLNKTKLNLCKTKIKFFGHYLTTEGLEADDSKIEAILNYPTPKDKKGVQRFLGMITYLGRYIKDLSTQTAILRRLTINRATWNWGMAEREEFERLKDIITHLTTLQYFDVNKQTVLECDASLEGLGAALMQEGRPIAFASRTLTTAERNGYAPIEKEMAAIVFGCSRFHQMLIGNKVIIKTDHKPLVNITNKPLVSAPKRLQMMMLSLQKYNLNFQYVQGKDNYVADALSRAPIQQEIKKEATTEEKGALICEVINEEIIRERVEKIKLINNVSVASERIEEIKEHTERDPTMQAMKKLVMEGWPDNIKDLRDDLKPYHKHRNEISYQAGLFHLNDRIIIPIDLRKKMIEKVHWAHNGIEATVKLATRNVFWPGMSHQIEDKVKMCETCAKYMASQKKQPMISHEIPEFPFQFISMDCGEAKINGSKKNLLITVDHFSDYFEVDILNDMTPGCVISATKANFARHGICQRLCTDQGTNFVNQQMKKFAKEYGFQHVTSSPNHQQGNGKAEAAVKIVKNLIKKANEENRDFELGLLHWRNTPNKIGSSPNQRLLSRNTQTLIPTSFENLKPKIITNVPDSIRQRRERAKLYYDKITQQRPELEDGQRVYVQLKRGTDKTWTPAIVTKKVSDRSYQVDTGNGSYQRNDVDIRAETTKEDDEADNDQSESSFTSAQENQSDEEEKGTTETTHQQQASYNLRNRQNINKPDRFHY